MSHELSGKVAVVARGASGIGLATLLDAGATMAALDRHQGGVGEVVEEGAKAGGIASG